MKKLKHSKYRNTGLIFEILCRYVIQDVLQKKKSNALRIIKKYFKPNTELYKELMCYQSLQPGDEVINNPEKLIDIVLRNYHEIDKNKLRRERYSLVGEIKNVYDVNNFFSNKIANYKTLASIFKIFEYDASDNPTEYVKCHDIIVENFKSKETSDNIIEENKYIWRYDDPDIRKLAYKIIIEKFNKKYSKLSKRQKKLLKMYINNNYESDTFVNYINEELNYISNKLNECLNKLNNTRDDDRALKIKLIEIRGLLDSINPVKGIKDEYLSAMMKYYCLIDVLK